MQVRALRMCWVADEPHNMPVGKKLDAIRPGQPGNVAMNEPAQPWTAEIHASDT